MPKRFIDTDICNQKWYRTASPKIKSLWIHLFCNCDNAGMWIEDYESASFFLNTHITPEDFELINTDKIRLINTGKGYWLIKEFIQYQIGNIHCETPTNLQKSCNDLVRKYLEKGIDVISLTNLTPNEGVDMSKPSSIGKGKVKDKVKGKGKVRIG